MTEKIKAEEKPYVLRAMGHNIQGSCGLGVVYSHQKVQAQAVRYPSWCKSEKDKKYYNTTYAAVDNVKQAVNAAGGTGFFTAAFVNEERCRKMYERLCADYKLVFQSPVRRNRNSGRNFIFCIFDRDKGDDCPAVEARWQISKPRKPRTPKTDAS